MYTFYIDTHSDNIVLGLYKDNKVLKFIEFKTTNSHSKHIMPLLDNLLKDQKLELNDINEVIVVIGPGSFTGIRLGVTIAKTIAMALSIPIYPITSLNAKSLSIEFEKTSWFLVEEKNGYYACSFTPNKELIANYLYIPTKDIENFLAVHHTIESKIDYQKIIDNKSKLKAVHYHAINPLYIKKIEVQS